MAKDDHTDGHADAWAQWSPRMLSVLRIGAGLLFVLHGTMKLFGFPPTEGPRPELMSLLGLAGVMETFGGLLIVLGLFTRPVAFVLALEMMYAYATVHLPRGTYPTLNGGEPAYLFAFLFLYLAVVGGGRWSLDWAMRRPR